MGDDAARRSALARGFAGWSQPHDLFSKVMHKWDLYTCCSAQGVRGLFNAWTSAVTADGGETRVNLLINHISRHAVVRSWLPHDGRVEVTPETSGDVLVRVPSWVDHRSFEASVDGAVVGVSFLVPGFARVAGVAKGVTVAFRFPIAESTTIEPVLDVAYSARWRGDTVVGLSPEGTRMPLYRRAAMQDRTVSMVHKSAANVGFGL